MENSVVETRTVKIGGREFTLAFTLKAMLDMQKSIEGFNFNNVDKLIATPDGLLEALYALAESGAKLSGKPLDVDKDWFAVRIPANTRKIIGLQLAVMETLSANMLMEAEEDENRSREVDLVLQEIQKKRAQTASHGEK